MKTGCKTCGKMKAGGTKKSCPPGYYWTVQGCEKKGPLYKKPLSSDSAKAAVATFLGGLTTAAANKIVQKTKAKQEAKKGAKETISMLEKTKVMKKGGSTDKKWIQKAINPAHKGYCTPMTKPTCTPKRKALAMTLKKMAKNR